MILTGNEIVAAMKRDEISITPFNYNHINPASVDLCLGKDVITYRDFVLDSKKSHLYTTTTMPEDGFLLAPGQLYLMSTHEVIKSEHYVTVIDGKSSIGRLGISIHQTAGYGDPGYHGQYTLEVSCLLPVKIYPYMRFCQARFHTVLGLVTSYQENGNYISHQGPVMGPKPSQCHRQWKP
jgi:dCTP deaminase